MQTFVASPFSTLFSSLLPWAPPPHSTCQLSTLSNPNTMNRTAAIPFPSASATCCCCIPFRSSNGSAAVGANERRRTLRVRRPQRYKSQARRHATPTDIGWSRSTLPPPPRHRWLAPACNAIAMHGARPPVRPSVKPPQLHHRPVDTLTLFPAEVNAASPPPLPSFTPSKNKLQSETEEPLFFL
jgi:hypothetical protein